MYPIHEDDPDGYRLHNDLHRAPDEHEDHSQCGLLCHDPPCLPEHAHAVEAAGWLCRRHHDSQGADDLHIEREEVAQEEDEQLHGQQHRARVCI